MTDTHIVPTYDSNHLITPQTHPPQIKDETRARTFVPQCRSWHRERWGEEPKPAGGRHRRFPAWRCPDPMAAYKWRKRRARAEAAARRRASTYVSALCSTRRVQAIGSTKAEGPYRGQRATRRALGESGRVAPLSGSSNREGRVREGLPRSSDPNPSGTVRPGQHRARPCAPQDNGACRYLSSWPCALYDS